MSQDQTDGGGSGTAPPGAGPPEYAELPEYAERVLDVAELIPPGRVMTYGDVAEWLGEGGPRQVGRVMALYGSAVPWWRVVRADGTLLPAHELRALEHYRAESTPLREASRHAEGHIPRIDMRHARWDGGVHPGGDARGRGGPGGDAKDGGGPGDGVPGGDPRGGDGPGGPGGEGGPGEEAHT
ncbi:MGMT family protein [Streptomyces parvus]|uniref:MGMT family protein n=1 Tax=Streptomyces parvus TaxID=66428 RepID=UPI0021012616|nr:MGMT family protein [Streptomyces parvus]MCQ1581774.1 MGMT family protein [Streptomyces parvus]